MSRDGFWARWRCARARHHARCDRFGKPWETIHGIRFVGEVAYAVTFLTTDPFYVVDLADPTAPTVVGELELPGFSSYLHPVDDDHVVGFGPDERGEASAKLFDVTDPTAPSVVDSVTLGSESAVTWDHHAFVSLGDNRFAIPASDRRTGLPDGCTDQDHRSQAQALEQQGELPCAHLDGYSVSAAITLEVADGSLREVERHEAPSASAAQRIIPSSAGWTFLEGGRLVLLDSSGAERSTLSLAD